MDNKFSSLPTRLKLIALLDITIGMILFISGALIGINTPYLASQIIDSSVLVGIFLALSSIIIMIIGVFVGMVGVWLIRLRLKGRTAGIVTSAGIIPGTLFTRGMLMELVPQDLRIFANIGVWIFIIVQLLIIIYLVRNERVRELFDENAQNKLSLK